MAIEETSEASGRNSSTRTRRTRRPILMQLPTATGGTCSELNTSGVIGKFSNFGLWYEIKVAEPLQTGRVHGLDNVKGTRIQNKIHILNSIIHYF